jgi:hypothetical protein
MSFPRNILLKWYSERFGAVIVVINDPTISLSLWYHIKLRLLFWYVATAQIGSRPPSNEV